MQRGLGGATIEPAPQSRDRELTLGPFMLTFIGCGLFALCGLCFVLGYAVGHQKAEPVATASLPAPGTPVVAQPANSQGKPSAGQSGAQGQPAAEPPDPTADTDSAAAPDSSSPTSAPAVANPAEPAHTVLAN